MLYEKPLTLLEYKKRQRHGALKRKIENSIMLLDSCVIGWVGLIDLDKLSLEDGRFCILGQLFGNYQTGLKELNITFTESYDSYAFNDMIGDYGELSAAWEEKIIELKRNC